MDIVVSFFTTVLCTVFVLPYIGEIKIFKDIHSIISSQ